MNVKTEIHVMLRPRNAPILLEITLVLVYLDTVGIIRGPAKVSVVLWVHPGGLFSFAVNCCSYY